jgi:hypothetical protein
VLGPVRQARQDQQPRVGEPAEPIERAMHPRPPVY